MAPARIGVIRYDAKKLDEKELKDVLKCEVPRRGRAVTWIDVVGIRDGATLEALGKCFGLHPLVLEDIASTRQRPKLEDYDDYV